MRTAIVTLATGDYIEGARVLFKSLEINGLPDSIDRLIMGPTECAFARPCPVTEDYSWFPVKDPRWVEMPKKFFPLLLDYDRVIYIDSDIMCIGDCSHLWSDSIGTLPLYVVQDTAAQFHYAENVVRIGLDPNLIFNAGMYVYNRLRHPDLHEALTTAIKNREIESYEVGDQGYWNHYFQKTHREIGFLSSGYNYCLDVKMPQLPRESQRLIHFTGYKPWSDKWMLSEPWTQPYYKMWKEYAR